MKKALLAIVAVAVAATFTLPAFAEDAKKPEKPKAHQFTGEITAVDVAGKSVTLKNKDGETKTVVLNEKSKVATADKKAAELSDLKVGDKVVASFTEEGGKNVALRVGPPAPPKEKKPKAEKAQ
jgi:Cu/Ag efflux protein CusF